MGITKQYIALLRMNVASIPQRLGLVFTIVISVACAVGVLVSMLAMGVGFRKESLGNVRPDRAVLTSTGSAQPFMSAIPKDQASLIAELPGVRKNAQGKPIVVPQVLMFVPTRDKDNRQFGFLISGMTPNLLEYLPETRIIEGRMFKPGLRELVVSKRCTTQLKNFQLGNAQRMRGGEWPIVGVFEVGGATGFCIVYADADTVLSTFGRPTYNIVNVMLRSPEAYTELTEAIKANPTLRVEAKHEKEVVEQSMGQLNGILKFVSYFVGSIMALAATIGAANSLYAIVDSRRRELATLRAIGFNSMPIIASMLTESILLALPGALLGALAAWLFFNDFQASPMGASFHLAVTPALALLGLGWALCMGLIGGLLPALRAARVPVSAALRAT